MMPAFAPWYEAESFFPLMGRQVIPINLAARRITRQRQAHEARPRFHPTFVVAVGRMPMMPALAIRFHSITS